MKSRTDTIPEAIFILASPRCGSTLLRTMLAGHSQLFSPPELNLLPFRTMAEREWQLGSAANCIIDCDQRKGLTEAVMNLTGLDAQGSEAWLSPWINDNTSTGAMYCKLQSIAAPRRLVDKSTLNVSNSEVLMRSLCVSPRAHYIHIVRHPFACIDSLQRTYLKNVSRADSFDLAESLWTVPNETILRFLAEIEPSRKTTIRFENLVTTPEEVMRDLCVYLNLDFEPALLDPYSGSRMTTGSPGHFRSVGDPNFHKHTGIDTSLSEVWRRVTPAKDLSNGGLRLAKLLHYDVSRSARPEGAPKISGSRGSLASNGSSVILVVPPFTYRAQAYLDAAKKVGLEAICALDPAYGIPDQAARYIPVSFEQPGDSVASLVCYARQSAVGAVLAIDDGGAELASLAAAALGLPHNPMRAIEAANNKYAMRLMFQEANVPSPSFSHHWLCENPWRISQFLSYPVVLKPLYLSGSRGVIRVDDPDEFVKAFYRIEQLLQQPGTGPNPKSLLVEEYIPGVEVSLEGVLTGGKLSPLGLYDKPDALEGPFFEETILVTPSRLPGQIQDRIIDCAARALKAVGLSVGPIQVELRLNERGPWVVELAARTMGGHCSRALPFDGSRTLEELVLSHAAGLDTTTFIKASGAHGVMMIPIPGEGILRKINGVQAAEKVSGVSGVMITTPIGAHVKPLPEGDKYLGFIFANAETPEAAENALRESHRHLTFELDRIMRVRLRLHPRG